MPVLFLSLIFFSWEEMYKGSKEMIALTLIINQENSKHGCQQCISFQGLKLLIVRLLNTPSALPKLFFIDVPSLCSLAELKL